MSQTNFIGKMRLYWDKLWYILWKDNSVKGWIISILFIFLFMKFIFFPTISFVTGTALPLAIVESCSMYHEGIFFLILITGGTLMNQNTLVMTFQKVILKISYLKKDLTKEIFYLS